MNCDEAFNLMTWPAAGERAALQLHLNGCPRCRDMRDALSPAMVWLNDFESCTDDWHESAGSNPLYLSEDAVQVAEHAAQRLARQRPATQPPRRFPHFGKLMTLAGLIAVLGITLSFSSSQPAQRGAAARFSADTACLWMLSLNEKSRTTPTADQLIATCAACHLAVR